ncbi:SMP-30/gluconolactonase/LRE family protein [Phyllobacterium leguminum]|uniref:Gluconolactonase n=1 Tax=Phyllobacterium leguminum TaxID=314237 RepID=A0A318T4G3_9HYPH|nr:SMP-30/gluconolactonase/LRE family protein [Phyllobacterium leguminum]PYE87017.1 gluconolactonase [Phyllobacterium leguminum]
MEMTRRTILSIGGAGLAAAVAGKAWGQSLPTILNQRYPDPSVEILDPSFAKYRIYSASVEKLATGMRWAEGPAYFPEERCLLLSDIPNNRIMKYDEVSGTFTVFRSPANFANGNARDREGRLITCEHSMTRRVTRTEKNGSITVLADQFEGKRLNAPNDVVVRSDGTIWFTDPLFGINGNYEGEKAEPEQATTNVYCLDIDGKLKAVITDLVNPNGLAFSPDEKKLYVVEWKGTPNRSIWSYDIGSQGAVSNKVKLIDAADFGALDGFKVDRDGNLWCGYGSNGALNDDATSSDVAGRKTYELKGSSESLDGVMIFDPDGKPIGFIRLPERCANLAFGGPKRNRLYMASSHSLYALYVGTQGAG